MNPDAAADGAPDAAGSVWIGARVDYAEAGPISNPTATADDANAAPDDEDGVTIATPGGTAPGQPFNVTVDVASVGALMAQVGVWIDFNADGDFADAVDAFQMPLVTTTGLGTTATTVTVPIPAGGSAFGTVVRVGVVPASAVNFTQTQAFGGQSIQNGEWEDYVTPDVVLSTRGLVFSARAVGGAAILAWEVALEEGLSAYIIQRSVDGAAWKSLAQQATRGGRDPQAYAFTDAAPHGGTNYYRLHLATADGGVGGQSPVARVDFPPRGAGYGAVAQGGRIRIRAAAAVQYAVYGGVGALLARGELAGGAADVPVAAAGLYLVRMVDAGDAEVWAGKVVVQ